MMSKQKYSRRAVLRYSLIQLPELILMALVLALLGQWIHLPVWIVLVLISLLVIVNIIMFPFVWRAYDKGDSNPMFGTKAIAVDRLSPSGYVRIKGEMWRANVIEGGSFIKKGEVVTVTDIRGLTLLVQSDTKEKS
jgi:membrane protein implicated in regulation of membrane protease activity